MVNPLSVIECTKKIFDEQWEISTFHHFKFFHFVSGIVMIEIYREAIAKHSVEKASDAFRNAGILRHCWNDAATSPKCVEDLHKLIIRILRDDFHLTKDELANIEATELEEISKKVHSELFGQQKYSEGLEERVIGEINNLPKNLEHLRDLYVDCSGTCTSWAVGVAHKVEEVATAKFAYLDTTTHRLAMDSATGVLIDSSSRQAVQLENGATVEVRGIQCKAENIGNSKKSATLQYHPKGSKPVIEECEDWQDAMKRCLKQYVKEPNLIVLFRCRNKNGENAFNGMVQFTWNTRKFSWSHRKYIDGKWYNVEAAAVFMGKGNKKQTGDAKRCSEDGGGTLCFVLPSTKSSRRKWNGYGIF